MGDEGELDKLRKWYSEEIRKKEEEIRKLKEENIILLKTSLKQANKNSELMRSLEDIYKKHTKERKDG